MHKEFGKKLKELREKFGLFQSDLAKEMEVAQNTISNWEKGKSEPSIEQIIKLAEIFNTTPNELQGFENPKNNISELERRLIKAGLKDKINKLTEEQFNILISLVDNFLIANDNKKN
ncbi:MAG: helix-turn-helix transcriptional regulator [Clostridiales bacterium]|nr:helix-turn-helix transcriptional regulator [Clostridiales bacterium]